MNHHKLTLDASLSAWPGVFTKITVANTYKTSEVMLDSSITLFFGYRSTSDPRNMPENATVMVNTPAMIEVAMTDRVSRYTQKVTANQTKLFVMKATREFASVE
jgi:23S rRNA A2030 N6-methylase RlmJ